MLDAAPSYPQGYTQQSSYRSNRTRRNRRYGRYDDKDLTINLANKFLAKLQGNTGTKAFDLPPKSYIAIAKVGPEVDLGFENVTEEASFHVVVGRW